MDFTLTVYKDLLSAFLSKGFAFQTFEQFITNPLDKVVIMRHDVDRLPGNALRMARIEHGMGIAASYYFRVVPVSWDEGIIMEIAGLGHEIGYHYENLSMFKGDMEKALADFKYNLTRLRELVPVSTVCMHGSPLSRIDNLELLKSFDYKELGIVAEPYLDVDYSRIFYITDTGRKWNNETSSVRDRVESGFDIEVRSTGHLIELIKKREEKSSVHESALIGVNEERVNISLADRQGNNFTASGESKGLPDRIMFNVHPQRWHDAPLPWLKELVGQNVKNVVKKIFIKFRD